MDDHQKSRYRLGILHRACAGDGDNPWFESHNLYRACLTISSVFKGFIFARLIKHNFASLQRAKVGEMPHKYRLPY